jgi:hypothetical protein
MKTIQSILLGALCLVTAGSAFAGNPERTGQAGATQLLVNPYGRSSGFNGGNVANTFGIESVMNNIAGLAHLRGTEVVFTHTNWLGGSDIRLNTFGFGQGFRGGRSAIGLSIMAFDFGDIERTTIDNPDGGIGTFSPTFLNINASYAREMLEDQIWVGFNAKIIHESVPDAAANGIAFDAGVQYRGKSTARLQALKLGVALRNVGPPMRYSGDGLTTRVALAGNNANFDNSVNVRSANFELPTTLWIGATYDFYFGRPTAARDSNEVVDSTATKKLVEKEFRITPVFGFQSQAYGRDQIVGGIEIAFKSLVALRVSQIFEDQIFNEDETQNAYTGLAGGISVNIPFQKGKRTAFGVDYSYRHTRWFSGTHVFGFRLTL